MSLTSGTTSSILKSCDGIKIDTGPEENKTQSLLPCLVFHGGNPTAELKVLSLSLFLYLLLLYRKTRMD